MKLIDTSVAIDHLRGYPPATALLDDLLCADDSVVASELTRFELLVGVGRDEHSALAEFFRALDWVPVTEEVTRRAGVFARSYRRSHAGIGVADYVIAGTTAALDADLLTVNLRHFPMFESLRAPYSYD